jgi:S1-C subfamily serine protease
MRLSSPKEQDLGIHFDVTDEGIRVTSVLPNSPAARIGLEPGDVILAVYGHPVTSAETWDWLMSYKNDYVELRIKDARRGDVVTRHVDLG